MIFHLEVEIIIVVKKTKSVNQNGKYYLADKMKLMLLNCKFQECINNLLVSFLLAQNLDNCLYFHFLKLV